MLFLFLSPLLRLLGVVCSCYSEKEREGKRGSSRENKRNQKLLLSRWRLGKTKVKKKSARVHFYRACPCDSPPLCRECVVPLFDSHICPLSSLSTSFLLCPSHILEASSISSGFSQQLRVVTILPFEAAADVSSKNDGGDRRPTTAAVAVVAVVACSTSSSCSCSSSSSSSSSSSDRRRRVRLPLRRRLGPRR